MTEQTIADRRMVTANEIAELEAQQGAAILDGVDFDPSPLWDKRGELEALSAAEAETVRRDRKAAALQVAEARELSRAAAESESADLLKAVAKAERAFAGAVDAIAAVLASAERLRGHMQASGVAPPMVLDGNALRTALSRSMGAELVRLGGRAKFGNLSWLGIPPQPEWGKTKSDIRAIAPLLEKEALT